MIVKYQNGNYVVSIDTETGTKIRETNDDYFYPTRVESMDVKITNQCHHNCPFCHENSIPNGKQASIEDIRDFMQTVPEYTECCLGGGNLMENVWHTEQALKIAKKNKLIASITVRQEDFVEKYGWISEWIKLGLVHGVGVSLSNVNDTQFWALYDMTPTAVIHVIAGLLSFEEMYKLGRHHARVLILGYKHFRRGNHYFENYGAMIGTRLERLKKDLIPWSKKLEICSFDNLALEQLDVQAKVPEDVWKNCYMGDDGTTSFYVDLVENQYAKNSTSAIRANIHGHTVQEMYDIVRETNISRNMQNDKD